MKNDKNNLDKSSLKSNNSNRSSISNTNSKSNLSSSNTISNGSNSIHTSSISSGASVESSSNQNSESESSSANSTSKKDTTKNRTHSRKMILIWSLVILILLLAGVVMYLTHDKQIRESNQHDNITKTQVQLSSGLGKQQDKKFLAAERKYDFVASLPYPKSNYSYIGYNTHYNSYYLTHHHLPPYYVNDNTVHRTKFSATKFMEDYYRKTLNATLTKDDSLAIEQLTKHHQNTKPESLLTYSKTHHSHNLKLMMNIVSKNQLHQPHYWNYYFSHYHLTMNYIKHGIHIIVDNGY